MKTISILLFLAVTFGGCTSIYFAEPQPRGTEVLESFPKDIQGIYIVDEEEEKDTIHVEASRYTYPEIFEAHIPMGSLDSLTNIRIVDNLLYNDLLPIKHGITFNIENDTLHYRIKVRLSTYLSDSLILKRQGNIWVLNEKEEGKNYWNVYLIEKLKNKNLNLLTIGHFSTESSVDPKIEYDGKLEDFYTITDFVQFEEGKYIVNPTAKEFKKLIKKGLFKELVEYRRINAAQ